MTGSVEGAVQVIARLEWEARQASELADRMIRLISEARRDAHFDCEPDCEWCVEAYMVTRHHENRPGRS